MDRWVDEDMLGTLEALLLMARKPVPLATLVEAAGASEAETDTIPRAIAADHRGENGVRTHGLCLRETGGGWGLYTNPRFIDVVSAHAAVGNLGRFSAVALETLVVIAYRQPVTRVQTAAIRGVSVDSVVRTLVTYGFTTEAGAIAVSSAALYGTIEYFLEAMGMNSLAELAPSASYLSETYGLQEEDT